MYKDILDCIDSLKIPDCEKKLLMEHCLTYVFSWNPFKLRKSEYYLRFVDRSMLINYKNHNLTIEDLKNKMLSDFYKEKINKIDSVDDRDLRLFIDNLSNNDIEILLALKTLNTQIWHERIATLWANILSILSLCIVIFSTFMKTNK